MATDAEIFTFWLRDRYALWLGERLPLEDSPKARREFAKDLQVSPASMLRWLEGAHPHITSRWVLLRKLNHPAWQEIVKGLKKMEEDMPPRQHGSAP